MLHTLSRSLTTSETELLLATINADDVIVLWQDGVLIGTQSLLDEILIKTTAVFLLSNDIVARGLEGLLSNKVTIIEINELVKLTEQHHPQKAW